MVVDRRHDHSFRVPRPDLSVKLGTPNACNDCHADKSAQWAASAVETWHGANRKGWQKYAEAFHSAWTGQADAATLLGVVAADPNAPAFARASALTALAPYVSPANINLARSALADPDPMVRIGALDMLANVSATQIWPLVSPLLADSNRGVRIRAVALLAAVPTVSQPPADREPFEHAAAEFVAAQRLNADRPEARSTLGNFLARRGLLADAEVEYKAALRLKPALHARGDQPRRSLSPTRPRRRGRKRVTRSARRFTAGCGAASRARPRAHSAEATRGITRRTAPCRRTRSRPSKIRVCLRGRAAFGRAGRQCHGGS